MSQRKLLIVGGGQSGLAAARTARDRGWDPVVLEVGASPAGSWPAYYDSLQLFSPSKYSGFPGYAFSGDPDRYPVRDQVVAHLKGYASWLGLDIRTHTRVDDVSKSEGLFEVRLADGAIVAGDALVAASGSFGNPFSPVFAGQDQCRGEALHVANYLSPSLYEGKRVVVVGAGNSAVQVAHEMAQVAHVSLASRQQVQFLTQVRGGHDLHFLLRTFGVDRFPKSFLSRVFRGTPVIDMGKYSESLMEGKVDRRDMFTGFTEDGVTWADGSTEEVDVVLFATGYRPHLPYLRGLGALDAAGIPRHQQGVSTTHTGLGYLGLEY